MRVALSLAGRICRAGEVVAGQKLKSCRDLLASIKNTGPCQDPSLAGYVGTYKGPREDNEDSAAVAAKRVGNEIYAMVVVADGVGGLKKGEVASESAVCQALIEFYNGYQLNEEWVRNLFDKANDYVKQNAGGGATTMTVALLRLSSGDVIVGNVGDSPMYAVSADGQLYDLTPNKDEHGEYILQAVGHPTYRSPHINRYKFAVGALIGVTDGVSDYLPSHDVLRNVLFANVQQATKMLLASVKDRTRDNATAAVLRIYKSTPAYVEDEVDTRTIRITTG